MELKYKKEENNDIVFKENIFYKKGICKIDASKLDYYSLNKNIRSIINEFKDLNDSEKKSITENSRFAEGLKEIVLENIIGQRYIGDGLQSNVKIKINGIAGNDLGAFMDGPFIEVFGNVQDGAANTMNAGEIIVHGNAGDILGYSMRGGEVYIRGNIGYRGGIHMKSYLDKIPVIVIGGKAGNFTGEYMAGGIIIILGACNQKNFQGIYDFLGDNELGGNYIGTGMHGGAIFLRGDISNHKLGREIIKTSPDKKDLPLLEKYINKFYKYFSGDDILNKEDISTDDFIKLIPYSRRPYGKLYAY